MIHAQRFDVGGQRVGTTIGVNSGELGNAAQLAAAGDAPGGFVAAWQEDRYPQLPAIVARRFAVCGDGVLRGEPCDDGNEVEGDGCDSNCTATACGNGILSAGELCDDGNLDEGDGCSAACRVQATFTPTATPTPTETPTARSVFTITGCVPHATTGCGFEFGSVDLPPLGRHAQADGGAFRFESVPPGRYTLSYSPRCNPFGCRPPAEVAVVDDDVFVQFARVDHCAGDCGFDGVVSVDDLVRCVTSALDGHLHCPTCDADRNGSVRIDDLIRAVDAALTACPA